MTQQREGMIPIDLASTLAPFMGSFKDVNALKEPIVGHG